MITTNNKEIYLGKRAYRILESGIYRHYPYVIQTLGSHPTAYIGLAPINQFHGFDCDDAIFMDIEVHGGFTYGSRNDIWNKHFGQPYVWFGWDYAHCYDYVDYGYGYSGILKNPQQDAKKWTFKEIKKEVKSVINQMIRLHFKHFKSIGAYRDKLF